MRLDIESLTVVFGGVQALSGVTTSIPSGERRAIIGPNGAGKTTLFNALAGEVRVAGGRVLFDGRDTTAMGPARRARLGLTRTFQRSSLYPALSVRENLDLAVRRRLGQPWSILRGGGKEQEVEQDCAKRLARAGLEGIAHRSASSLGHGQQRTVEIELALALEPRLLLLDEPAAGLSSDERQAVIDRVSQLDGTTLLVVEHDLDFVFALADIVSVLDHGVLIAEGSPNEVRANPRVQEVYLGIA